MKNSRQAKFMTGNAFKTITSSLLFSTFTLAVAGCEMGYEREKIGEEGERKAIVEEERIAEGEEIEV